VLFVAALALAPGGASADPDLLEEILARAQANGSVRVVVKLYAPDMLPEGAVSHDQLAVFLRRLDISDLQDIVLDSLVGTSFNVLWRYATSPYMALEVSAPALTLLSVSLLVEEIVEDFEMTPRLAQSGPLIQATDAAALGMTGAGQNVVIVDTGVDRTHPFLAGRVVDEWCFVTTAGGCPAGTHGTGAAAPVQSHGTHVAGIAAGAGASFSGVAPGAGIVAMKVFSSSGSGTFADVKAALDRVVLLKDTMTIASVNMSLGATGFLSSSSCNGVDASIGLKSDIDALRAAGIASVVANGNSGSSSSIGYPACITTAIKVGATTKQDTIVSYSDRSPSQESSMVFAPGGSSAAGSGSICSSRPASMSTSRGDCPGSGVGGSYGYESGTSMATPHVAGAWAVLKQVKPTATVDEVLAALRSTATPITDTNGTTYRRINVRDAVAALTGLSASISANKTSPQPIGTAVRFTATSTGGIGTISYKWRVFDGATWTIGQDWSTTATFDRTFTTGAAYTVSLWARSSIFSGDDGDGTAAKPTTTFVINNPTPSVSALSPTNAPVGSAALTLTVTGANFVSGAVIRWNGSDRTTTFVNATQLRATIAAADLNDGGTRSVSVTNPGPGGGASNALVFAITGFNLTPAQLAYAKSYAAQAWANYFPGGVSHPSFTQFWNALPQGLKDTAMEAASKTPPGGGAAPGAPAASGTLTAAQMQYAQAYAAQTWANYFPGGVSHPSFTQFWNALPQGLKDTAMEGASSTPAATSGGSNTVGSGGSPTAAAIAYAAQNWPNYKTWDSLPQYLKDAAISDTGGGSGGGAPAGGGGVTAAMLYAAQTWPNYFPGGVTHPNFQQNWNALPQSLKDAAQAAAG
jgi:hypothetical protein